MSDASQTRRRSSSVGERASAGKFSSDSHAPARSLVAFANSSRARQTGWSPGRRLQQVSSHSRARSSWPIRIARFARASQTRSSSAAAFSNDLRSHLQRQRGRVQPPELFDDVGRVIRFGPGGHDGSADIVGSSFEMEEELQSSEKGCGIRAGPAPSAVAACLRPR